VRDALRRVGEAAQQLGDQAGEAVRSPEVRQTAQRATRSLADALETTFGQITEQLRGRGGAAGGTSGGGAPAAGDSGAPAAADRPQSIPGPHPDPAPGEEPTAGSAPTRPPADS
jgi:hypothetical protein